MSESFCAFYEETVKCGLVDASAIFIDRTHIKASANKTKNTEKEIAESLRSYQEQLDKEIDEDREVYGKKPFDRDDNRCSAVLPANKDGDTKHNGPGMRPVSQRRT